MYNILLIVFYSTPLNIEYFLSLYIELCLLVVFVKKNINNNITKVHNSISLI